MQNLTAQQVDALRGDGLALIDVLPEEHYRKKHIPGSNNVPLAADSFLRRVEHVAGDRGAKVVVYCADADCNASPEAARKLEDAGFTDVADFSGGLQEWERAGLPLEGSDVDQ